MRRDPKMNYLQVIFLVAFANYLPRTTEAAVVAYDTETTANRFKEFLESQKLCQVFPNLPSCLDRNATLEAEYQHSSDVPVVDMATDNAFLTMAMDYVAKTQQRNEELRELEIQQVAHIAKLEQEKQQLQDRVRSLEEEWLPTIDKHPGTHGRSLSSRVRSNTSLTSLGLRHPELDSSHLAANFLRPVDCADHLVLGARESGVYKIYPFKCRCSEPVEVWCDMETDGGGWTVFLQRRNQTHPLNFTRSWNDYKKGFGNASDEYWLGNEHLSEITGTRVYSVRLDFQLSNGNSRWAEWPKFFVNDESNRYKLEVPMFNSQSTTDNCLSAHSNKYFSTFDYDNDGQSSKSCATDQKGGWWYYNCAVLNPTIPFTPEGLLNTTCTYRVNNKPVNLVGPSLQLKMRPNICGKLVKAIHFNSHTCEEHNRL